MLRSICQSGVVNKEVLIANSVTHSDDPLFWSWNWNRSLFVWEDEQMADLAEEFLAQGLQPVAQILRGGTRMKEMDALWHQLTSISICWNTISSTSICRTHHCCLPSFGRAKHHPRFWFSRGDCYNTSSLVINYIRGDTDSKHGYLMLLLQSKHGKHETFVSIMLQNIADLVSCLSVDGSGCVLTARYLTTLQSIWSIQQRKEEQQMEISYVTRNLLECKVLEE